MKQLMDHHTSQQGRFGKFARTAPIKSLLLALLAVSPLIASASTAGTLSTDALLPDAPFGAVFDWPRFSLLAAGIIALVCARATVTTKTIDDINSTSESGNNF